jgi:hypothetical protein
VRERDRLFSRLEAPVDDVEHPRKDMSGPTARVVLHELLGALADACRQTLSVR